MLRGALYYNAKNGRGGAYIREAPILEIIRYSPTACLYSTYTCIYTTKDVAAKEVLAGSQMNLVLFFP